MNGFLIFLACMFGLFLFVVAIGCGAGVAMLVCDRMQDWSEERRERRRNA